MTNRCCEFLRAAGLRRALLEVGVLSACVSLWGAEAPDYVGRWALTIPGGGAGWLEIKDAGGYYDGNILWGGGSVVPVSSVFFDEGVLCVTRTREVRRRNTVGQTVRTQQFTELLTATLAGDTLQCTQLNPRENGRGLQRAEFTGKRCPPLPPAPDLSQVKFGEPIALFNGQDLTCWRLI